MAATAKWDRLSQKSVKADADIEIVAGIDFYMME